MILGSYDEAYVYPGTLILDARSFYKESVLGNYYISVDVFRVVQEVTHILTVVELVVGSPSWVSRVMKGSPKVGELGQVVELPYQKWRKCLEEKSSPLFYLGECSDAQIMQYVPHDYRYAFPDRSHQLFLDIGKFQTKFAPEAEGAPPDIRKAYARKMFSAGAHSKFLDKFNL